MSNPEIRVLPSPATVLVAICRKCGKKLGGGFGKDRDRSLAKTLRADLGLAKGKRAAVRFVETACLDICPKGAVVVVRGDRPASTLIVARGAPSALVATELGLIAATATKHGT